MRRPDPSPLKAILGRAPASAYLAAAAALGAATGVAWVFHALGLDDANRILAYLLAVTWVAASHGRGPSICASFAAVLLFNFFFTEPRYTFLVHDTGYVFTFGVMLVIALLVSTLTARVREQSEEARLRELRAETLYQLSRRLSAATGRAEIVAAAEEHLARVLGAEAAVLLPDERGRLPGGGAEALPGEALRVPLADPGGAAGVLAIRPQDPGTPLLPAQRRLVETFAAQIAMALERDRLTERIHRALAQAEAEKLRSSLLSSVSHDFRTPLAAIAGASSTLIEADGALPEEARGELLRTIFEESERLTRLVDNLLHITRIESGQFPLRRDWNVVEDLVGSALTRLARRLGRRPVATRLPEGLPLVRVDAVLVEQVLINLIENAAKYAPEGSEIAVSARVEDARVVIEVADRGPGVPPEERERIFEKFCRGARGGGRRAPGAGLGLAICQAVATLHGGRVRVDDREGGGARFGLALPLEEQPPAIEGEGEGEEVGPAAPA